MAPVVQLANSSSWRGFCQYQGPRWLTKGPFFAIIMRHKKTMKKLIALLLIGLFALPAPSAQALLMLSDPDGSQLIENIMDAESIDFNIDVDFETMSDEMSEPITIHVDYDGVWDMEQTGSFDLDYHFTSQDGFYETFGGSMIVTSDRMYFSEDEQEWYFIEMPEMSYASEDDTEEVVAEIQSFIKEMFDEGVIEYAPETADFINGQFTVRYAYELDNDRFVDYLIDKGLVQEDESEEMRTYLNDNVTVGGNVWIDTAEMLPVMFTFAIESNPSETSYTKFELSVLFNGLNEPVLIDKPENAIDLYEYDNSGAGDLVMASLETAVTDMDIDGDGLSNEDEMTIWNSGILSSDTDNDGYDDYIEVINGYNPNGSGKLDSDGDGLTDYNEMTIHWSDPYDADSDNDGYEDGIEIANGYDPNGPGRW